MSSHLLSEMALMADHLVVIGRGSLIASGKMTDFISTSHRNAVVVRVDDLRAAGPRAAGAQCRGRRGADRQARGHRYGLRRGRRPRLLDLGLRVFELSNREATLEEAFLDATGASEEFRASMGLGGRTHRRSLRAATARYAPPSEGYGPPQQGYGPPATDPRVNEGDSR